MTVSTNLDLEAAAVTSTTSTFELATSLGLSTDIRSSVFAVHATEMSDRFAGVTRTSQQQSVGTGGSLNSQLIQSHNLTTSLNDAGASRFGEAKSADADLGDVQQTNVVSDGTNNNSDGLLVLALQELGNAGQGKRRAVHLAHHQSLEDDFVELGVGSAGQEGIKLNQKLKVRIVRLSDFTVSVLSVFAIKVDTLNNKIMLDAIPCVTYNRSHSSRRLSQQNKNKYEGLLL
jgi:hypothetical protein